MNVNWVLFVNVLQVSYGEMVGCDNTDVSTNMSDWCHHTGSYTASTVTLMTKIQIDSYLINIYIIGDNFDWF